MKHCAKCGRPGIASADYYRSKTKDGFGSWCKRCLRSQNLRVKHGITIEEYEEMLERQKGKCASCEDILNESNAIRNCSHPVDHCHRTGKIRGVLCHPCNTALGLLYENPDRAEKLISYMKTVCV